MGIHRFGKLLLLVLVLGGSVALALHPGVQRRANLVAEKLRGHLPVAWKQLAVAMVPRASLRASLRDVLGWAPGHWVQSLDYPDKPEQKWTFYPVFNGPTACLRNLESHFSILQAGQMPHPPHQHGDEEIIVLLSGGLVVIREDAAAPGAWTEQPVRPGDLIYHASEQMHTLRSAGPEPARYFVLRWGVGSGQEPEMALPAATFPFGEAFASQAQDAGEFTTTLIFESPTRYLRRLHCHVSTLRPGAGYDPHEDDYDVAMVLLSGTVETAGRRVEAPSAIFYSADQPHGIRNVGDKPAQYVVLEFHGPIDL